MQVRRLKLVAVDDADAADAGTRQVTEHRHTKSTGTDDHDAGGAQLRLAGFANLLQRLLT